MFREKMVSLGNRTRVSRVAPNSRDLFDWATQPWLVSKLKRIEKRTLDVLIFSLSERIWPLCRTLYLFSMEQLSAGEIRTGQKAVAFHKTRKIIVSGKTVSPCRRIRRRRMRLQSPDRKSGHHDRFRWRQTPSGVMQVWRRRWPFLFAKRFVA